MHVCVCRDSAVIQVGEAKWPPTVLVFEEDNSYIGVEVGEKNISMLKHGFCWSYDPAPILIGQWWNDTCSECIVDRCPNFDDYF